MQERVGAWLGPPEVVRSERGSLKALDVGSIVFFGMLALLAIFLDRSDLDWVEDYSQVISSGALAVIALGSLAFTPFTEQYAPRDGPARGLGQARVQADELRPRRCGERCSSSARSSD